MRAVPRLRFSAAGRRLAGTLGTTLLITGLGLVTSVLVARSLGPDGRGVLLALTFWPALLTTLLCLSINESTIYHIARATLGSSRGGELFASSGLLLQIFVALAMTPVAVIAIWCLHVVPGHEDLRILLWYTAFFLPLTLLDVHFKAVLQGRGNFLALNGIRLVQPTGYATAIVILVLAKSIDVATVMVVMLATVAVSFAGGAIAGGWSRVSWARFELLETVGTGLRFHLANVLSYAATEADKLIVLLLMNTADAGYYAVGIGLSTLGSGIAVQSLYLLLGRAMPLTADNDRLDLLARNLVLGGFLLISIDLVGAITAPIWLPLMYGEQFRPVIPIVMILFLMGALKGLRQIIDRALRAGRMIRAGIAGELIALAGLVACGCVGAFAYGLTGLVCGLVVAQLISLVAVWYVAARAFGIAPGQLAKLCGAHVGRLRHLVQLDGVQIFTDT